MKRSGLSAVNIFVFGLMFFLGSGCSEEQPAVAPSLLETTLQLTSPSAMGGKITIDRAYLKLGYIQAAGTLGGKANANVQYQVPPEEPPFELTRVDSIHATLTLPAKEFDQLDLLLLLAQDDYQLPFTEAPVEPVPAPSNNGSTPSGDTDQDNGDDNNNTGNQDDDDDGSDDDNGAGHDDSGDQDDDDGEDEHDDEGDGSHDDDKNNKDKNSKDDKKKDKHKKKNKHENDGRTDSDGQLVDLDEFFQNAKPAMVIIGTYENNGQIFSLILVATDFERLVVHAQQNDGYHITLGDRNAATVTLDPDHLFEGVSATDIESSPTQMYQGRDVLFIHKAFNSSLYKALITRLEESCNATISSSATP